MLNNFFTVSILLFSLNSYASQTQQNQNVDPFKQAVANRIKEMQDDINTLNNKISSLKSENIKLNSYYLYKYYTTGSYTKIASNLTQDNCLKTLIELKNIEKTLGTEFKCEYN